VKGLDLDIFEPLVVFTGIKDTQLTEKDDFITKS
jgi:hypothetical protein